MILIYTFQHTDMRIKKRLNERFREKINNKYDPCILKLIMN